MGKTAVFVLSTLQNISDKLSEKGVQVLVLCHTRELAYQIQHEFIRLGKHVKELKIGAVYGGVPMEKDRETLKKNCPHILVGTPGRVLGLMSKAEPKKAPRGRGDNKAEKAKSDAADSDGVLSLSSLSIFIVDECDRVIDDL